MSGTLYLGSRKVVPSKIVRSGGSSTKYNASIDGLLGDPDTNGVLQYPNKDTDLIFTNITTLTNDVLSYRFQNHSNIISIDMSDLTNISGENALIFTFYNCSALESVDLSNLTTITGISALYHTFWNCEALVSVNLSNLATVSGNNALDNTFTDCKALESLNLSNLTTISGNYGLYYAFKGCEALKSIDLSSLTTIGNYGMSGAFTGCSSLITIDFTSLEMITGNQALKGIFTSCSSLTTVYFRSLTSQSFGSYTNQFNNMLYGCSNVTVHFPSNLESIIGNWEDVINGFGSASTTVAFDLTATE